MYLIVVFWSFLVVDERIVKKLPQAISLTWINYNLSMDA